MSPPCMVVHFLWHRGSEAFTRFWSRYLSSHLLHTRNLRITLMGILGGTNIYSAEFLPSCYYDTQTSNPKSNYLLEHKTIKKFFKKTKGGLDMKELNMELLRVIKLIMKATDHEKQIPLEPHWEFCYSIFMKDVEGFLFGTESHPKYIFAYKKYMGFDELLDAICVWWCVLRALDTVEDEPTLPSELKVPILENFHRHIYDRDLPISCGIKLHHKVLMDNYYHASTALLELPKGYQTSIENIAKTMGAVMAKFILNEVETVDDYNEYCYNVNGIFLVELSKHLHASNLEDLTSDHLPRSMGLLFQKAHFIIDFFDDINEIPKGGRMYWPRQIWSKYVDKLEDLIHKENSEKAVCCLNDMVTDALSHVVDSIEYLSTLRHSGIFRLYASSQNLVIGTLSACYNNIEVFRGKVESDPGQRAAKIVLRTKSMSTVYEALYDFSSAIKTKIDSNDPSATKTLRYVEEIQKVCENSGLLNQRSSFLETGVGGKRCQVQQGGSPSVGEQVDPFSLVADELSLIGNRLREMVVSEVPKLALAAEYFFEMGVEGKRFRPTVLLLMASSLNVSLPESVPDPVINFSSDLRTRQQRIAEITEMIHVASLLHDDVLDDADTRRGVRSLNILMGNKLSVLAGDFLLSRVCVGLASVKDPEVFSLMSAAIEHLVAGEIMQMTSTSEDLFSMDQYMRKTYYKTASLIANSCKSIAILAGQTTEDAMLAYDYGRNLGLAYQLIDDVLDFTGTSASLGKGSLSDIRNGIITAPILNRPDVYMVADNDFVIQIELIEEDRLLLQTRDSSI